VEDDVDLQLHDEATKDIPKDISLSRPFIINMSHERTSGIPPACNVQGQRYQLVQNLLDNYLHMNMV